MIDTFSPAGPALDIRRLSVVIPVYNSQDTLGGVVDEVVQSLASHFESLEIVLVNDGSRDRSHQVARDSCRRHPGTVKYLRLARNFGEHNAVLCGLRHATGDCAAIIDDDFQNPPEEILALVERLAEGYDVVYSFYEKKHHSWYRNLGSRFNDLMATWLLKKPRGLYLSSFKVMSAFLTETVTAYDGPYPYLDGLILRATSNIGHRQCRHAPRQDGRSGYTLRKLIALWLNMFTGHSVVPLRVATLLGFLFSCTALLMTVLFVISWTVGGIFAQREIPPGWASLIVSVTFFSGVQLCVLGLLGEYLGRTFLTQNRVPQSVVREVFSSPQGKGDAAGPAVAEVAE